MVSLKRTAITELWKGFLNPATIVWGALWAVLIRLAERYGRRVVRASLLAVEWLTAPLAAAAYIFLQIPAALVGIEVTLPRKLEAMTADITMGAIGHPMPSLEAAYREACQMSEVKAVEFLEGKPEAQADSIEVEGIEPIPIRPWSQVPVQFVVEGTLKRRGDLPSRFKVAVDRRTGDILDWRISESTIAGSAP